VTGTIGASVSSGESHQAVIMIGGSKAE